MLRATAAAVWLCAECGHGSPDPRDERAHLDAHRQLRAFFEEWDAGTATPPTESVRRARGRSLVYAAGVLAVLLVWSLTVFSHVNRAKDGPRATLPPAAAPAPAGGQSSGGRQVLTPPAVSDVRPAAPAAPAATAATAATIAAPATTTPPPAVAASTAPPTAAAPSAGVSPAPTTAAPPAPDPVIAAPPAPAHLLSVCLLGICVTVL